LIALRPDAQLAPLLGLEPVVGALSDAYLLVHRGTRAGAGIVGETMQYHGAADLYALRGATPVASLCLDAATESAYPAVTSRDVGSNGGRAIAFTYDLARSIVYTRQGNPEWAQEALPDGSPRRPYNLFFETSNGAGKTWLDPAKASIPQADEQQRLLANLIVDADHHEPLPRFWYLPRGLKAAIVMTGDDHGDRGIQPRFDIYRRQSPPNCSVDDWECVRATTYAYVGSAFTAAQARFYNSLGFETAVHLTTNGSDWTRASLEAGPRGQLTAVRDPDPGLPAPVTSPPALVARG